MTWLFETHLINYESKSANERLVPYESLWPDAAFVQNFEKFSSQGLSKTGQVSSLTRQVRRHGYARPSSIPEELVKVTKSFFTSRDDCQLYQRILSLPEGLSSSTIITKPRTIPSHSRLDWWREKNTNIPFKICYCMKAECKCRITTFFDYFGAIETKSITNLIPFNKG